MTNMGAWLGFSVQSSKANPIALAKEANYPYLSLTMTMTVGTMDGNGISDSEVHSPGQPAGEAGFGSLVERITGRDLLKREAGTPLTKIDKNGIISPEYHTTLKQGRNKSLLKEMEKKEEPGSKFKVIQGGRRSGVSFGSVRITAGPEERPPFPVEAVVFEEDTFLVLSADWKKIESEDHPVVILTEAFGMDPEKPGRVVVYEGSPLRFLAVIHDLDQEPSWREEWVGEALENIFQEVERRRLQSIALPFLGTQHGSLEKSRFLGLLRDFLKRSRFSHPLRIWLVMPGDLEDEIIEWLEADWEKG